MLIMIKTIGREDEDNDDEDDADSCLAGAGPKMLCNACGVKLRGVKRMQQ